MSDPESRTDESGTAPDGQTETARPETETSIGTDANVLAAVGYVVWFVGFVFYAVEEDNDYVRFHGLQAGVLGLVLTVAYFGLNFFVVFLSVLARALSFSTILSLFVDLFAALIGLLNQLVLLAWIVTVLYMALKTYQFDDVEIPVLGGIVERQL